ncbi:uncharacterized protein LOC120351333 isoform X1 [Nilaparvata lugens]|uniref:uncharacterized protein LOC120351333 isoform X1 n=2 Tax=Nilaparvata lugens TaxID=108931 RepID=UPI00193DF31B|nr:uncharacterized protein LOC120351333 isoform X1 [Nilaparvata lugens]
MAVKQRMIGHDKTSLIHHTSQLTKERQTTFQSMEYHVCGKIAKVVVNRLEDVSTSRPQIKVQVKVEKQESPFDDSWIGAARSDTATQQIKIEKQEDEFGECEFAASDVKDESSSHNGSTSNQASILS